MQKPISDPTEFVRTLIPKPVSVEPGKGAFSFTKDTKVYVQPGIKDLVFIGQYLAEKIGPSTGFKLALVSETGSRPVKGVFLSLAENDPGLGDEGYLLKVSTGSIHLSARKPAGLFWGVQTLRQMLQPAIEHNYYSPGPWQVAVCTIRDFPRFSWRGVMLDVARHFFSVDDVKRYIDLISYYKMNRFHLHLSDDQGWRLMIDSWPRLAELGGSSQVGGGAGGFYTKAQYSDIVAYARCRYITVVPEIDMPGHTNAALASYPELNCDGVATKLYTGTEVGFSSLCVRKEVTFKFLDDVIREIAELTPDPYLHIGGDEAAVTSFDDYKLLMERVQAIVHKYGKIPIGWEEIAQTDLLPSTIAQYWNSSHVRKAVERGNKIIMSPASKVYLDMKYTHDTPYGLTWAGNIKVSDAYHWEPAEQLPGVSEAAILGIEAPLWTETIKTIQDVEFMAFPRLPGVAELAWSPGEGRNWEEYKIRLAGHGMRLTAMNVNFYHSSEIPWEK